MTLGVIRNHKNECNLGRGCIQGRVYEKFKGYQMNDVAPWYER